MDKITTEKKELEIQNKKPLLKVYFKGVEISKATTRLICLVLSLFMLICSFITIISIKDSYKKNQLKLSGKIISESTKEEDIKSIKRLSDLYDKYYDYNGHIIAENQLLDYKIETDKFNFPNLGSYNSEGGMCAGFSMYEKLNYMNELKSLEEQVKEYGIKITFNNREDLSEIILTAEDKINIYGGSLLKSNFLENLAPETLYNIYTQYYCENPENFSDKITNEELANVLNIISYLQKNAARHTKDYPKNMIAPNRYIDSKNYAVIDKSGTLIKDFNPEIITQRIDNNEPVIVGIGSTKDAHALLIYKYEYINESTLKLYISDSNIVLIDKKAINNIEKENIYKYNYDVKNNVYMLLTKRIEDEKWEFIYNPKLNDNYLYQGKWNSYIPGANMRIYE